MCRCDVINLLTYPLLPKSETVKCQQIFDNTYRLYKRILFLGCNGSSPISFIQELTEFDAWVQDSYLEKVSEDTKSISLIPS